MGTPNFAVPILKALIENYKVRAVVTQPDKKVGRDGILKESPIKQLANQHTILVLQPEKLKDDWQLVTDLKPNLIVTCAYGQIVPRELLVYPEYGCINVHASLLPKLRGGAPIHRAIIEGYSKTGVTIMYMNPKLDEGDIITQKEVEITELETASSLHDKLSIAGTKLLLDTLPSILNKTSSRTPQNQDESTYAFNIRREDEQIKFSKTKKQIYNQIRGLNSWPGAYCKIEGKILKVWESRKTDETYPNKFDGQITKLYDDGIGVKVGNGEIVLTLIQLEGKTKMKASDLLNGLQNKESLIGKILT
ncbi:MAG: methionyl-tRNA formyltransferase [Bacilli bacterium]